MLSTLLPLLEALGGEGGAATALGGHSGIGSSLGRLLGGSEVRPFAHQQEFSDSFRQISDLTASIAQAKEAMSSMRQEHEALGNKAREDERLYGFRDPGEADRMADLQAQQIEHARQMQQQQQQMEGLQARAAVSMDPQLAGQEQRRGMFRRAGAMALAGQAIESFGPSVLKNLPGVQPLTHLASFGMGETNSQIAGQMGDSALSGASNVVGGAMKGASIGSLAGPGGAAIGAAVGGVAAAATEIAKLPTRIKDWSESLLSSQKTISRFSGVMAQAFAQREVRGLKRDIESANITGGPTADLSKNLEDLYDTLRPLKDVVTVQLAAGLSGMVTILKDMVPVLKSLLDVGLMMVPGGDQLRRATEDRMRNHEFLQNKLRQQQGGNLTDAIRRLKAEDPLKPRQAPRR